MKNKILILIMLIIPLIFIVNTVFSQNKPVRLPYTIDEQEIRRIANLTEQEQRQVDNQRMLQQWFIHNAENFITNNQNNIFIQENLVNMGDINRITNALAPPLGTNANGYVILWTNIANPTTGENAITGGDRRIEFPRARVNEYLNTADTCYEEAIHAILGQETLIIDQTQYPDLCDGNMGADERREHCVINSVFGILDAPKAGFTTPEVFNRFHERIRNTGDQIERLGNNVTLTQDQEREIWFDAYTWINSVSNRHSWNLIKDFPADFVNQYHRLTNITIPSRTELNNFYMNGGIKSSSGKPVKVPEWVLTGSADTIRNMANFKQINNREELIDNKYSKYYVYKLLTKLATTRGFSGERPVIRGVMTVKLESSELIPWLHLRLINEQGKVLKQFKSSSGNTGSQYFEVDLNDIKDQLSIFTSFEVELFHKEVDQLKKDTEYTINLEYFDKNYSPNPPGAAEYNSIAEKLKVLVKAKTKPDKTEIEEAFKNKNWKKLIELYRKAKTDDEKKLIYDYLKQLATEFNNNNKTILEKLKNHKTKNDSNYQSYFNKASAELKNLKNEEARKLSECMNNTKEKYERENLQIERAISYFENLENDYNNMTIDNAGEFFFQGNEKKQLSVPYDLDKPFPEVNYDSFCSNTKAVNEIKKAKVTLRATNKNPKPGEIVEIEAIIERPQLSIGCPEQEYFEWTGENIALSNNVMGIPESTASFVASKPGSYSIGVTASCMDTKFGNDSITITVQGGMTGKIRDLDSEVYFGSSKNIRLDTSLDALSQATSNNQQTEACLKQQRDFEEQKKAYEECIAANANKPEEMQVVCRSPQPPEFDECAGKTEGSYSVLWQSSEEGIKFLPKEGSNGNTTITFTRMSDNLQIWAEVRQFNNGKLETIGRVDNFQVKVLPPDFTIAFDPPSNKAKIGETITAEIKSSPFVDLSIIDYRWVEPTDRKEITTGKIEFVPKDIKPIKFHVIARVPHYGDNINDSIKDEYTPGEYEVVAKLLGPKFDKNFPDWSEKDKGLTYKPLKLVTGQQILASVTTKDIEPEKVNYEWKSNDGCHIDAGHYSNEVTVSRNEPGACDLTVTAYDKDKRRLGEAKLSFNVMQQDTGGTGTSTDDKDKDKVNKAKKDANEKFEKAKDEINKGNLDEAIIILDEASTLDPDNTQIKVTLNNTKEKKKQISIHINKADQFISQGNFIEAEKEIEEAKKINSNYKTITETVTKIKTAKSQYAEKLFNEANQLITSGKLNEAIIKLDEAVILDPANKNITTYKDKITSEKSFIDKTAKSFNLNISNANYEEAEKEFEAMASMHPNYQPVIVAKAIWNSRLPERMGQITGALQQSKELVAQGKLDEAIQLLEDTLIKAKKIKEAPHLASQVLEYLNKLKSEKTTVLNQITKAKQLLSEKNFNEADKELAAARQLHGYYQPVKDATAFYDAEKKKYADNSQLVNGKIQKAKWLVEEGKLDEAITWADDAVSLDPNNLYSKNYADQLKTERTTCLEQVEKVKTLVTQNNIESAKKELQIAINLHPKYTPVTQASELINSIEINNTNVIKEKINQASIALSNNEYKKVLNIVYEVKKNYKLNQQDSNTLTNIESTAKKALSDKDQAIVSLKAGENQYNQQDYQGAISNFEMGLGKYSYVWEPTDPEPKYYSNLLSSAKKKMARINQLMNEITRVVQNNSADIDTLKNALNDTIEVLYLQPANNQAQSYKNILTDRLKSLTSKPATQNNITSTNNQTPYSYYPPQTPQAPQYPSYPPKGTSESPASANTNLLQDYLGSSISNINKPPNVNDIDQVISTIKTNQQQQNTIRKTNQAGSGQPYSNTTDSFDTGFTTAGSSGSENTLKDHLATLSSATSKGSKTSPTGSSTSTPTSAVSAPTMIVYNGNPGACSFTDTARFNLSGTNFITDIKLWYNWQQNQTSLPYSFYGPAGQLKTGTMVRGSCDPYQNSWCNAEDSIKMNLSSGSYTVKVANGRICQNSGTGGNGTIRVYAGSPSQTTVTKPPVSGTPSGTTTSSPPSQPPQTVNAADSKLTMEIMIMNESSNNVHLFTDNESFGPGNKVAPGASRIIKLTISPGKSYTFFAGRNGQVLANIPILYGNLKDYSRVHLKFNDSQELYIHERFKRF